LRGQRLKGLVVGWGKGADACIDPQGVKPQTCTIALSPGLPTDVVLSWLPQYGRFGADVTTYDALGNRVDGDAQRIHPARVILSKPLVQATGIDVVALPARVVLTHPE